MIEETEELRQARAIETGFQKAYMKAIGLDSDLMKEDLLGTKWFEKLKEIQGSDVNPNLNYENMAKELKKFEGYQQIISDLKYFAIQKGGKKESTASSESGDGEEPTDIKKKAKKKFGGFAKSVFGKKKKKKEGLKPLLRVRDEKILFELVNIGPNKFVSPYDCKEK